MSGIKHDLASLKESLDARLRAFETECKAIRHPSSTDEAEEYLWDAIACVFPYSIYLIFLTLRWCLDQEIAALNATSVLDIAVRVILTRDDNALDFDKWIKEDMCAVVAWLSYLERFDLISTLKEHIQDAKAQWLIRMNEQ